MYNRRYEKVFLMLRQETAGYAIGKRPPWGSCVMELKNGKGRLHLTAQGLKPFGYEVYVLAEQESLFCGRIWPEKREGRCEMKWDFDPDAVGAGKKAEDFHTVLVLAEGTSAPLAAYFGERRDWRADFKPRTQSAEEETPEKTEVPLVLAAEKQEEAQDTNEKVAEMQKDHSLDCVHGSFQGLLAKFRQELEELEETGILTKEETEHIRSIGAETEVEAKEKATEEKPAEEKLPAADELSPFGDGQPWKRLSLDEMPLLSEVPLRWKKEFFFLLPYRKYHHLILQEKDDGFWLGVPGQFHREDAADAHAFGFHEFRGTEGEWGYWLAFLPRRS